MVNLVLFGIGANLVYTHTHTQSRSSYEPRMKGMHETDPKFSIWAHHEWVFPAHPCLVIYGVSGGAQQPVCTIAGILPFIIHNFLLCGQSYSGDNSR